MKKWDSVRNRLSDIHQLSLNESIGYLATNGLDNNMKKTIMYLLMFHLEFAAHQYMFSFFQDSLFYYTGIYCLGFF